MSKHHPPLGRCRNTERTLFWTAILAPLIVVPWFVDIYNLPKMTLLCCGVSVAWIFAWRECSVLRDFRMALSRQDTILLIWLALYGIATAFSVNVWQSFWGQYRFHSFGLITAIAGYALYYLLKSSGTAESAKKGLIISGLVIAAFALFEYVSGNNGRINSLSGSPIYYSGFLVPLTPIALAQYFTTKRIKWLILFVVFLLALVVSMARGSWIAEIVSLVILGFFVLQKKETRRLFVLAGTVILSVIAAALLFTSAGSKFSTISQSEYFSNVSRIEGWKSAVSAIKKRPLTGYGPDNFVFAFRNNKTEKYLKNTGKGMAQAHAHNDMLQMAATAGIPCAMIYAAAWVMILVRGAKKAATGIAEAGVFAAFAGLFVYLQFNNGMIGTVMLFWILAASIDTKKEALAEQHVNKGVFGSVVPVLALSFIIISLIPMISETAFVKGMRLSSDGKTQATLDSFQTAYSLSPHVDDYYRVAQDTTVSYARAVSDPSVRNELIQRAVRTAELNTRHNAANPDAWHNLASVLLVQYRMTGLDTRAAAAKAIVQSIRLDPYNVEALAGFAGISVLLGRQGQAQRLWLAVQELEPENQNAKEFLKGRNTDK